MFNSNCASVPLVASIDGNGNSGNGAWGDGGWLWIIVVFALLFGWGGNGFGGFGGNGMNGGVGSEVQRGFDTQTIVGKLDRLGDGICSLGYDQLAQMNNINQNISNGFHGVDNAICNLGYNVQQGFNTTNIALMQGQNALQTQLAQCCCENREGQAQIRYDMATNTCALQNTMHNNTRDIIDNQNAGTREILNYLCQKENADLRAQVQKLELSASQAAQNNFISANQEAQTAELLRRLGKGDPVNAVVVQPNTPVTFPVNGYGYFTGFNNGCNNCCA